jgi:predicted nucleic acid-binding protein
MPDTRYLLDANVFITAARQYYPFDFAPGFWKCLEEHAKTERVQSIDRVKDELLRGKDDLADWAKGAFAGAFASTSHPDVLAIFAQIMTWAQSQSQFMDAAKAQFAGCADGWLVAYARVHGLVVVTHETYSADARNKIKIPNVCRAFSVEHVDTWAMLRGLGAKLG